jgi:type II secretory pathway component PulF
MLFNYKAVDLNNVIREGTVEAPSVDGAIAAVQKRGYTLTSIEEAGAGGFLSKSLSIDLHMFQSVKYKEIVILSRQVSTLFQARVSPLRIFRLLSAEVDNPLLKSAMNQVVEDLQAGSSISRALANHGDIFSPFYINLVRAGEESGSLEKSFSYLADYLDRQYEVISKARNALIYPAFVVSIFFIVMGLMLTLVIPNIAAILTDAGQDLPIYTKIVIGLSDFLSNYMTFIIIGMAGVGVAGWRFSKTDVGKRTLDEMWLGIPFVGDLVRKLLLTRICDNLSTMLSSGSIDRAVS